MRAIRLSRVEPRRPLHRGRRRYLWCWRGMAIPLGPSSEAPVMRPGPSAPKKRLTRSRVPPDWPPTDEMVRGIVAAPTAGVPTACGMVAPLISF
jgi:hypothetical protein